MTTTSTPRADVRRSRAFERVAIDLNAARWREALVLGCVVALSFVLSAWNVNQAGWGNTYYAAAVRSMTLSWSNFFFGAFDPGGYITVDKPPVFLWFGALSARLFGYSSASILLPSAVAGAISVGLLWVIVKRYFGIIAATMAGLALALTPISVAVNRLNLPEPFMILALIGATASVLRSLESERRWWAWTALAGFLVGVAFNTKMLAAWIPGPALALALVVGWDGTRAAIRPMVGRLAVLGLTTLLFSASWMLVVDAWPSQSRPFIGGSTDNTVQNLALGYNGFGRVEGEGQGVGGGGARPSGGNGNQGPNLQPKGGFSGNGGFPGDGSGFPRSDGPSTAPSNGAAAPTGPGAQGAGRGGPNGAGGIIAGAPSLSRMFDAANGGQVGWLLPLALIGGGASLLAMWRRPLLRAALAVFLGWVLLYGGVFSFAQGIYHSYYTAALAPGVAALVGISVGVALESAQRRPFWVAIVGVFAIGATASVQVLLEGRVDEFFNWAQPYMIGGAALGSALIVAASMWKRLPMHLGLAVAFAALLLLPAGWSISEASHAPVNTTLPQAGPGRGASGQTFGSEAFDGGTDALATWLEAHRDPMAKWDLVVQNAQGASTLIAGHSLSVMALGGFMGSDPAMTVERFAQLVADGQVRYVSMSQGGAGGPGATGGPGGGLNGARGLRQDSAVPGRAGQAPAAEGSVLPADQPTARGQGTGGPGGTSNAVMAAVRSACTPVTDSSLPSRFQGAIYDCQGHAEALQATRR